MTTNNAKSNPIRRSKTSALFQIKQNTQQNIQIGQSMNIISLGLPSKHNKRNGSESNNKNQVNQSFNNNNRNYIRRANQSAKLTIKLSGDIPTINQENKFISLHNMTMTQKKLDFGDVIEKFQKKNMLTLDKNKIYTDVSNFQNVCAQFVMKIQDLQYENSQLNSKIKKYENYFKELKAKENSNYEGLQNVFEVNSLKVDKNAQLKILNLERKVETLNYIIKNYRTNNKQQVKQFQKKVNEYKPTIEGQLTQLLAQANKKIQSMSNMIQYFQKQCQKYYKNGNWVQLVRSLQTKDENINKLEEQVTQLQQQNSKLKQQCENEKVYKQQCQKLNREVMHLSSQCGQLKKNIIKLKQQKISKQIQCQDLTKSLEQLNYKYETLIPLQAKIKQKQQVIRRNSQTLNRIQNQNSMLKTKIGAMVKNQNAQLFDKQTKTIQSIQKYNTTIQQLANRFCEEIQGLPQVSKQLTSFITHLYEKTKISFQKIVNQYRQQLQQTCMQNKQLKSRITSILQANKKKHNYAQQLIEQMQNIENKRKRCIQSQSKIQNKSDCSSCINWILHWGQINSLYTQMENCVKKFREIQK